MDWKYERNGDMYENAALKGNGDLNEDGYLGGYGNGNGDVNGEW